MTPRIPKTPAGTGHLPVPAGPGVPAHAKGGGRAPELPDGKNPPLPSGVSPAAPVPPVGSAAAGAEGYAAPSGRRESAPGATPSTPVPHPGHAAPAPSVNPRSRGAGADPISPVRFQAGPPEGTRSDAVPSGGKNAEGLAAWRKALAGNAKAQRNKRGKHRAEPGYRPGMTRRQPPGGAK